MLKSKSTDTDPLLLDLTLQSPAPRPPATIEGLHCFVETEELRRLLCLMACTELLSELCRSLRKACSAREMTLPPAFL
jgi:hypothetical protein